MSVLLRAASDMSFLDGLLVFLIGNCVVVLALAFLVVVVIGYSSLLNKLLDKKKAKPVEASAETSAAPEIDDAAEQEELVAVISAAIAAVYASESESGDVPSFRVKSIIAK